MALRSKLREALGYVWQQGLITSLKNVAQTKDFGNYGRFVGSDGFGK